MNILMIPTSHDILGETDKRPSFSLEEFAAPYYVLLDAGAEITLASPAGGLPPLDPQSNVPDTQTVAAWRFNFDDVTQRALCNTTKLADIDGDEFDAIFFCGGHGRFGYFVTEFSNAEEEEMGLTDIVPFLVGNRLKANGGLYENEPDRRSYFGINRQRDMGQNHVSSEAAARELLKLLQSESSVAPIGYPVTTALHDSVTDFKIAG